MGGLGGRRRAATATVLRGLVGEGWPVRERSGRPVAFEVRECPGATEFGSHELAEQVGGGACVAEGGMGVDVGDAVGATRVCQRSSRQSVRVDSGEGRDREIQALKFRFEEADVERSVVRDENVAGESVDDIISDFTERWCIFRHRSGDAVDVGGAKVSVRVDERRPFVGHFECAVEVNDCDFSDAISSLSDEASRFDVEDGESRVGDRRAFPVGGAPGVEIEQSHLFLQVCPRTSLLVFSEHSIRH